MRRIKRAATMLEADAFRAGIGIEVDAQDRLRRVSKKSPSISWPTVWVVD